MMIKKIFFRLVLILPTLIVLVLLEIGYRGYLYYLDTNRKLQFNQLGAAQNISSQTELRLKHMIQPIENPLLIYDLIPSINGKFIGKGLAINESGVRQGARKGPNNRR